MPMSSADQRQHERINVDIPIKLDDGQTCQTLKIINISLGGLGLLSRQALEPGKIYQVTFDIYFSNDYTSLSTQARSIHNLTVRRQYINGLQFEKLSTHQKFVIATFIQQVKRRRNWR